MTSCLLVFVVLLCSDQNPPNPKSAIQNPKSQDTCLAYVSENLAKGGGNWYGYYRFSDQKLLIRDGDVLSYEIFLDPRNPVAKGAVDVHFTDDGAALRDLPVSDQYGVRAHGDGLLEAARGVWLTREIPLSAAKGRTASAWGLAFEGNAPGLYVMFVDNVRVRHAGGQATTIYENGAPAAPGMLFVNGYTIRPGLAPVDRAKLAGDANLDPLIAQVKKDAERLHAMAEVRKDVEVVRDFLKRNPDRHLEGHLREAERLLKTIEDGAAVSPEQLQSALHAARNALSHTHPVMKRYTGHLVGHAHIDLQWLWEWQEGRQVAEDTFRQAVIFMDEFPGFTFSQSSSALYRSVEESDPALFKKMQEKVRKGQWEIVGGRVCEADTNMISAESHARHFLYGQAYFKEKFGRRAVVGWEPDTFGHTAQMPQMLRLAEMDSYYFCRAGKGKPLFWWEAPDGTRVLAFEEPATGSWYNNDPSYAQFKELLDFEAAVGSKELIWVYGVGNHGGGPTREHLNDVVSWMKKGYLPNVKFSTATQFFAKLKSFDLSKIPVIKEDLNPVFEGCYTTHAEIKQLNREAENWTTSAEAVATVASFHGFKYPSAGFRRNWEDVTINHHHDTLPGSGFHAGYENTKIMLNRVIADDKDVANRAMQLLSMRVAPKKGGISVMVFNPLGWTRSGWVETYLVKSGWDPQGAVDPARAVAKSPGGSEHPVQLLDKPSMRARFWAEDVPAFGWRVFQIVSGTPRLEPVKLDQASLRVESDRFVIGFDRTSGQITSMFDKTQGRDLLGGGSGMGRLENHHEQPVGMSAWTLGNVSSVESWKPLDANATQGPGFVEVRFDYSKPGFNNAGVRTTASQTFRIESGSPLVTATVECDWQHVGTAQTGGPLLRVAFDTDGDSVFTTEVPFGAVARPTNGSEWPALRWADLSAAGSQENGSDRSYRTYNSFGLSILNDSKHGYSADGKTLRLSLIRSPYDPDPVPNQGHHVWRYAIVPHSGGWREAGVVRMAAEFNQPLLAATVPYDAHGNAPLEWTPLSIQNENLVPTCLKVSEDGQRAVLRFYESAGRKTSGTIRIGFPAGSGAWLNLLEDRLEPAVLQGKSVTFEARPFEIKTLGLSLKR